MLTITSRRLLLTFIVPALFAATPAAQAETITFDGTFASPTPPSDSGVSLDYGTPTLMPPNTFRTQGFTFNGFTAGVTGSSNTQPVLSIATDTALCPSQLGTSCVSDGTQYLATAAPFGFFPAGGGPYALHTFDASQVFGAGGCAPCSEGAGVPNATTLQLTGFRSGVIVAQETFPISSTFQPIVLTDPDWADVTRTVFLPLDATGARGYVAIDNISAGAVPEPSWLVLIGAGIAALAERRLRLIIRKQR